MVRKGRTSLHVLVACFYLWIIPYGVFITAVEATSYLVMTLLVSGPILSYLYISYYGIPPPPEAAVVEVLGDPMPPGPTKHLAGNNNCKTGSHLTVYAHRFAGIDAPENTMYALEQCIQNGAKGVEFDVIMTADGVPVVFHDPKLERMTGLAENLQKLPYSKIKDLDVSVHHHFRDQFPDARIPLFEDVVKKCLQHDLRMIIDIKEDRIEIVDVMIQMFSKYPEMYKRSMVSSFNPWIIYNIRKTDPSIVGALAWRPHYMSYCQYSPFECDCIPYHRTMFMYYITRLEDLLHTFFFTNLSHAILGISAVLIYKDNISLETINYWSNRNVRTMAWTVNSPLEKQYLVKEMGIPYITDSMLGTDK